MAIKPFILFDFNGVIARSFTLVEGMSEVIKELSHNNSLVIISSDTWEDIIDFLDTNNLSNCFEEVLGSDSLGNKAYKMRMIIVKYHLEPRDCMFITDTISDLREAKKASVRSIAVTWGLHSLSTLVKGEPWLIVNSPEELLMTIRDSKK